MRRKKKLIGREEKDPQGQKETTAIGRIEGEVILKIEIDLIEGVEKTDK